MQHLGSKKFQRIEGDISMYTSTLKCQYPGKVVTLQKKLATFIKARIALMWMKCLRL